MIALGSEAAAELGNRGCRVAVSAATASASSSKAGSTCASSANMVLGGLQTALSTGRQPRGRLPLISSAASVPCCHGCGRRHSASGCCRGCRAAEYHLRQWPRVPSQSAVLQQEQSARLIRLGRGILLIHPICSRESCCRSTSRKETPAVSCCCQASAKTTTGSAGGKGRAATTSSRAPPAAVWS